MRVSSRAGYVGVVAALVVCPVALTAERIPTASFSRVDVLLTAAPMLSDVARASMMNEAAAIWRAHGVILEWVPATAARPVASNRLRVLVVSKRLAAARGTEAIAVGELIRPPNGHPLAIISIDSAQQLISSVRGKAGYELVTVDERRLGVVLGRALAHEIGHYLLGTRTHARSGLMRANFDAFEFTDFRAGTFALDAAASEWLRTRDADTFAYAHR